MEDTNQNHISQFHLSCVVEIEVCLIIIENAAWRKLNCTKMFVDTTGDIIPDFLLIKPCVLGNMSLNPIL